MNSNKSAKSVADGNERVASGAHGGRSQPRNFTRYASPSWKALTRAGGPGFGHPAGRLKMKGSSICETSLADPG
jgi:hypothetical protein